MAGNYLEDIDNFLAKLGPPDQLLISRFEVGCNVCTPNFVVGRNFNTKAKLVNHFKSETHAKNVETAEARKEDHIKTLEENLFKVNEEIKSIEDQIEQDNVKIRKAEESANEYKNYLLYNNLETIKANGTDDQKGGVNEDFMCPSCSYKSSKLKKFKKHLHRHSDSACQMLLLKLA